MNALVQKITKEFKEAETSTKKNELYATFPQDTLPDACRFASGQLNATLVSAACSEEEGKFRIDYVFSARDSDKFMIFGADLRSNKFQSITPSMPAASGYEREMHDMFGVVPEGHPDLRRTYIHDDMPANMHPLRKSFKASSKPERVPGAYQFRKVEGEGVYEIPVGPVHAGIIGPGHFRFSVSGEPILALETRLGYTHKGVEKRFESMTAEQGVFLAERISGDNSLSHAVAYCQAIERAADMNIPERAACIRTIFLELERVYYHLGDIAGIATDVGYSVGAADANRIKEMAMRLNEETSGSRVLRGIARPGGARIDIKQETKDRLLEMASHLRFESKRLGDDLLSSSSLMDRVERTGVLKEEIAREMNIVGPAARASNVNRDVRRDHPYAAYGKLDLKVPMQKAGDVLARTKVKMEELSEACGLIERAIWSMPEGKTSAELPKIKEGTKAIGCVESPRGELIYYIITGKDTLSRCKVRDPSQCNWIAMEYAVPGCIVPDFPLVNKSFNLSYSGNDL